MPNNCPQALLRGIMKRLLIFLCGLLCSFNLFALSGQAYMDRFNRYLAWYEQLPINPSPEFLEFVKENTPLANKLRDKWLYELARIKDWEDYNKYYQPTNDINLRCFAQIAKFNLGLYKEAIAGSIPIWLTGESRPQACNTLFALLLKQDNFDQKFITQRITLALDNRNVHLARYLLKQYKTPHDTEIKNLTSVYENPSNISKLNPGKLNDYFYLYGLKRLVSINMDKALKLWQEKKTKIMLNERQKQAFLAHLALYKAMRNHADAQEWFAKIKPEYYTDVLVDWQIRFALKNNNWKQVEKLINNAPNKEMPCWQYWLARSLEEQGKKAEAIKIYEPLAKNRHYYGFLASKRLKKRPSFDNEKPTTNKEILKPYQPVIAQVKNLYNSKQLLQASRLLNDFISELPKEEASALVYWIATELKWHGKSVYLSNNDTLNNQLALRFPLAYKDTIKLYASKYAIPPELVYAIIRQESGFREDVTSSAGAKGLMQVMPQTASAISKTSKIPYSDHKQLFLSQKNINIGIAYLQHLTKRFSNHPVLVAAAYNAGPRQVVYWLKNHPPKEIDIWIETLPWQETRNYLKNVMAFYIVYQYRLNQQPDMNRFLTPL
ncbi:TPA: transglycosylase SLT domain-containing protein [Legionella pneumophila]|uniref:Lytic murein transglycosylase n=3 Tax=Legionella pneumophila TaxID=446 RepID=A0A2S6F3E9_LEGPN|nr:lytic murein transglycosylase [Legionella pneumophila]TIG99827.1 lytic murein transglycosylase [Legionella pneumophila]HAT6811172.1 transglycosylase SLT domain-containing protein [Legionella pneumophila]HAT6902848.1 transglycosylase SLT domain-containing protein [Legionella pneumophila]HAT6924246.1 transglycosylase SLT domain-containing protein [Legionella pneumophila]